MGPPMYTVLRRRSLRRPALILVVLCTLAFMARFMSDFGFDAQHTIRIACKLAAGCTTDTHTYRADGLLEVNSLGARPIFELVERAEVAWAAKLAGASTSLRAVAAEYTRCYARLPPRGLDKWWAYATAHSVPLPDEHDQIDRDLTHFYGMDPADLQRIQRDWEAHADSMVNFTLPADEAVRLELSTGGFQIIELLVEVERDIPTFRAVFSPHDNPKFIAASCAYIDLLRVLLLGSATFFLSHISCSARPHILHFFLLVFPSLGLIPFPSLVPAEAAGARGGHGGDVHRYRQPPATKAQLTRGMPALLARPTRRPAHPLRRREPQHRAIVRARLRLGTLVNCEPAQCAVLQSLFEFRAPHALRTAGRYKNGWSSRFKRLMNSGSLIFKAMAYPEWFMDRIAPWMHYIPVRNSYADLLDALVFFRGEPTGASAHDDMARRIAAAGREWSRRYWRKEDLTAYMYRLFLEYARVMSTDREGMSFVIWQDEREDEAQERAFLERWRSRDRKGEEDGEYIVDVQGGQIRKTAMEE
ncbi:hypothetical protein C8R44DRAFT_724793 [Mycena epipterygia]|nr:hypothetical protein C8R44DRAFT_724793 [Mycena epipterygia]